MEVENQYSSYEVAENKDPNYGDFLGSPDQDPSDKRQRKQLGARKQWDDYEEYAGSGGPGGPIGPGPMIPEAAMGPGPGPGGGGYGPPGPGRSGFGPGGPPGYRPPGPPDYRNGPPLGMGQYGPGNGPNMGGPGPGYGPYQGGPPGPRYGPGPGQMGQGGPGGGIPDYANGPMGPRGGPMGLPPGGPMGPMQGGPVGPMQGGPMVPPPGPDYQRVHPEIRYNYGDPNNDPNGPSPQFIPRSPPNRPGMARQGPSFNPGNYGQPPGSSGPGYDYGEGPTPDHGYTPGEPQLQYTDLYGPDANGQNIGPEYGQGGPQYGPGGSQYNPGGPQYGPGEPQYGTDGPQYGPGGPQYGPGGPQYGPGGPQYGPGEPQDQSIYRVSPPGYGPPPGLGGQFNQHSPPGYGPGPDHNQHKNPGKPGPKNYGSGGPYGGNLANPYTTPKKPPASKRGAKTTTKAVARNKAAKNVTQSKKPIKVKEKPTPPKPFTTTATSASIKYKTTTVDPDVTEDPFEEYKDYDPLGTTKGFEGMDSKTTRERQTETPSTRSEAERLSSLVDSFDLHPKFAFINDYHKMKKEKKLGIFTNFVVHVMDILAKKDIDFVDRILMSFTNVYEKYYNNGELSALGEPAGRMAMDYLWDITIHYQEDPRDVFKVLFTAVSDRMAYLPDDVNIYLTFLDSLFTHDDEQDILDVVHSLYEYPNNPKMTCDIITENMINKVYVHKVKQLAGTPKINILTVSLNTMLTNRFGGNIKITTQKVPKKYRRMNYETTVRVRTTSNPIILQNATSFSLYTYLKNITLHSNLTSNSTSTSNSNATSNSSSTPNSALTSNSTSKLNSTLTSNSTSTSNSSSNSTSCTWPQQKQILTSAINNTVDRLGNNFKFVLKVNNTRKELLESNGDDFDEGSSSGLDLAAALTGTRRLLEPRRSRHHRTKQRSHRYRPRNRHKHTHQHRNTQKHHKHEHTKSQNHERKRPNIHKQVRDKIHKYEKLMERLERGTREAHLKPDPYSVISKEDLRHHHRKKHHSKRRHKRRNRHHGRKHRNWRREVKGAKLSKLDLSESEDASSEPEMFGTKRFSVVPKHDKPDETPPPKPAEPPKAQRYKFMNPALRRPANLGKKPENPESLKEAKREGSYKQGIYVKPVKPPDNKSNEDSLLDLDNDDDASASASTFNQKNDARKMGIKLKRRRRRAAGFTTTTSAEKIRYPIDENRYNVIKLNDLKVSKKTNASAALKYIKRNILRKIKQLSRGLVANFKKLAKNLSVPSNESDEYQIGKSNMFKALGNLNYLTDITNSPATVSITPVNLYPD
ncbi:uncharacterized protein LOC126379688 [Pectinophora gossypiella]|uniref:uncharacterized protein LOC126379688 n=1 Tax=Pectinophora gossypiella TaxID=13191 RepID=UPI00214E184B|nr:uncharacterized protein LOC126379688 [Pectinophora gossypiella]